MPTAGLPKDETLRQAQIDLIRSPIEVVNEKGEDPPRRRRTVLGRVPVVWGLARDFHGPFSLRVSHLRLETQQRSR
jgi:hypothetical protein